MTPITAPPRSLRVSLRVFSSPSSPMQGAQPENQKLMTVTELSLNSSLVTALPSRSMPSKAGNLGAVSSSIMAMLPSTVMPSCMLGSIVMVSPGIIFSCSLLISSSSLRMVSISCCSSLYSSWVNFSRAASSCSIR